MQDDILNRGTPIGGIKDQGPPVLGYVGIGCLEILKGGKDPEEHLVIFLLDIATGIIENKHIINIGSSPGGIIHEILDAVNQGNLEMSPVLVNLPHKG